MRLSWTWIDRDPSKVAYFVDGVPVGEGENGFNRFIEMVSAGNDRVVIGLDDPGTGGESIAETVPFDHRMDELLRCLNGRVLEYDLFDSGWD